MIKLMKKKVEGKGGLRIKDDVIVWNEMSLDIVR